MKKLLTAAVAVIALAVTTATASAVQISSPTKTDGASSTATVGTTQVKVYSSAAEAEADTANPAIAIYQANSEKTSAEIDSAASSLNIDTTGYTSQVYELDPNSAYIQQYNGETLTVTINDARVTSSSDVKVVHFIGGSNTNVDEHAATAGNGTVTFSTNHFSPFAILVKAGSSSDGSKKTSPDTGVN